MDSARAADESSVVPASLDAAGTLRVPASWRFLALGVAAILSIAMLAAQRWHGEHYVLIPLYAALPWFGPGARRLSVAVTPFLVAGILYDLYGLLMPFRPPIHVSDLYLTDLAWFGLSFGDARMLVPDWLALHSSPLVDFVTGAAYILYLAEIFALAIWFHFKDPPRALVLGIGFLVMNLLGMVIWFAWPAAPPWYVSLHGLGPADMAALPSPAGAARFDALIGYPLFHNFYSRSVNVFGAMPSLHSAYPTLVFLTARTANRGLAAFTFGFAALVVFSAMYLQHHYVLDVIAGITTGAVCFVVSRALGRWLTARVNAASRISA